MTPERDRSHESSAGGYLRSTLRLREIKALHARIALAEELLAEGQPWQADSHRPRHENCVMCGNDWPCHTRQVADFLAPVEVSK